MLEVLRDKLLEYYVELFFEMLADKSIDTEIREDYLRRAKAKAYQYKDID